VRKAIWMGLVVAGLLGPAAALAAVVLDASKVTTPPSAAVLSYTAGLLGTIPAGGRDVVFRCTQINPGYGQCIPQRGAGEQGLSDAAWLRFSLARYDMTGQRKDGPWDVAVHFDPKDVLALIPPADIAVQMPPTTVHGTFSRSAGPPSLIDGVYPERAMRLGKEGTVILACQIQPDLSLACVSKQEAPAGYGFSPGALRTSLFLKAPPTLEDGSASPGKWVFHVVQFKLTP